MLAVRTAARERRIEPHARLACAADAHEALRIRDVQRGEQPPESARLDTPQRGFEPREARAGMTGLDVELASQAFRVIAPDVEAVRARGRAQRREIVGRDVVVAVAQCDRHGGRPSTTQSASADGPRRALDRLRGDAHRMVGVALHPHEPREHRARERRHVDAERCLRARRLAHRDEFGRRRLEPLARLRVLAEVVQRRCDHRVGRSRCERSPRRSAARSKRVA